jgi:glutamate-1-semialdehyde 2,1-aminomutase
MGVVPPAPGFLEHLRTLTERCGALLIFDEVITGFRVAYGGAQKLLGIRPDLTTLGKIIGGGLPVGAYGGPAKIMDRLSPDGDVYQAGTLSGNPVAVAAGITTLEQLMQPSVYDRLDALGARLGNGLLASARRAGLPAQLNRVGSMLSLFFTQRPVVDFDSARTSSAPLYARYFWGMLQGGHYFAPSCLESAFVSAAHTEADIDATLAAAQQVFSALQHHGESIL